MAVTVTDEGIGVQIGAVYKPPEEIVPVAELPPAIPFTLQATATLLANCRVPEVRTAAVLGETVTLIGGWGAEDDGEPPPQLSQKVSNKTAKQPLNLLIWRLNKSNPMRSKTCRN